MVVYTVTRDNNLKYEDHWAGIVKICSTREIAESYVKEEIRKWEEYYEAHPEEWDCYSENPTYYISEEEVL